MRAWLVRWWQKRRKTKPVTVENFFLFEYTSPWDPKQRWMRYRDGQWFSELRDFADLMEHKYPDTVCSRRITCLLPDGSRAVVWERLKPRATDEEIVRHLAAHFVRDQKCRTPEGVPLQDYPPYKRLLLERLRDNAHAEAYLDLAHQESPEAHEVALRNVEEARAA